MRGRVKQERSRGRQELGGTSEYRAFLRGFRVGQNSLLLGAAFAKGDKSWRELTELMRTIRGQ